MNVVKVESAENVCHGCLSTGRRTAPLGDYSRMYYILIGSEQFSVYNNEEVKLCWECRAMLKKLLEFQNQMKTSQNVLQQMLYQMTTHIVPLSKLSTTTKDSFDYEFHHFDIIDSKTNINTIIVDIPNVTLPTVKKETEDDLRDSESESKEDLSVKCEFDSKDNITTKEDDLPKVESDTRKKKKKEKSISLIAKYKMYARTIGSKKKNWGSDYEQYFTKVFLSEKEIEDLLSQTDRKQKAYANFPYKCKECHLGYLRVIDYYRHNDLNHHKAEAGYQCRACRQQVPGAHALAEHWREHCGLYRCTLCGDHCRQRMLKRHLNFEHTRQYGCRDCRLQFGSLKKFAQHYKESHGTYICHHCNKVCSEKRIIEKHIAKKHSPFECKPCNKRFARYDGLRLHNKLEHRPASPAYCVECDKQYKDVYHLKWHLCNSVVHTPRNKLKIPCPSCDKIFSKNIYMKDHYNLVHLKVFKYRCDVCHKNFNRNADLLKHKRRIHEGIRPPNNKICQMCGRGFASNEKLQNHVRTHTGERPFACASCGARFSQRAALRAHARAKHGA